MSDPCPPTRRHSWLRFGLRSLLVMLTIACVWLAIVFNQCRRQRRAVEAIVKAGGVVGFDYQAKAGEKDAPVPGPPWLRRIVGDDMFRTPVHVEIRGEEIDDEFLQEHLPGVRSTEFITVNCAHVTDASMPQLAALRNADMVSIISPRITDQGLASLQAMDQMEALYLACPQVTDAGLKYVARLPRIESLTLNCPRITPDGIRQLQQLEKVDYFCSLRNGRNGDLLNVLRSRAANTFNNVPVADALEVLTAEFAITIHAEAVPLDWRNRPFTFEDRTRTNEQLLERLLEPVDLGFVLDDGAIKVTTKETGVAGRAGYRAARDTFPNAERIMVDW